MANLLDTIRQNSQLQPQGQTDETQKLQGLLRAKSGREIGGGAVAASSLGEQSAVSQSNQQLQNQVLPQAQIQQQGLEQQQVGQQQQADIQGQQVEQQRRANNLQNKVQTEQILSELERTKGQVDTAQQGAKLEQAAFNLRMQNKQYVDNLQRQGNTQRLDNELNFQDQMQQQVLGDKQDLLEKQLGNKSVLEASNRDFTKSLADMKTSDAYEYFRAGEKAENDRAWWQRAGAVVGTAPAVYGAASENSAKKDYYNTGGGKDINSFEASKYRDEK